MAPALPRFIALYAAMFAAYGVASPFFPAFAASRGLPAAELGVVLGAASAVRLLSAPLAGRAADRLRSLRTVLVLCVGTASAMTLGFLPAHGFVPFLIVAMLQAAALAPMTVLADALALGQRSFEYGWVRGTGSAAFVAGTLLSGQLVGGRGLELIVWLQAGLLAVATIVATRVPEIFHHEKIRRVPMRELLRIPLFRNLVLVAALVLGSHAMHDAFAVIRWRAAGISPEVASALWSESVAAEVVVFFLLGPRIIGWITPAGAIALAAIAGVARWIGMAQTTDLGALALLQPLHGLTFALLHLSCMRLIARVVPAGLEGTAQAVYGTLGVGAATALLTLASGALYGRFGAQAFWAMAALCAAALPLAWRLRL